MNTPVILRSTIFVCLFLFIEIISAQSVCPEIIETNLLFYSEYSFSIEGIDAGQSVNWNFGDGEEITGDSSVTHAFMAGTYLVTAVFFDSDCPWDGPSVLSVEIVVEACGIDISFVETKTALFTFTAVGFPEEYPMHWDMGDGTYIEETWVVDNLYEPGTYEICAWYYTEFCPDTVEACVEMVYAPDTTCSAEFSYELIEDEELGDGYYPITALHAWNNSPEYTYIWDFGEGPIVGSADTLIYSGGGALIQDDGTQVCLTTFYGTCSDTVCHQVMNCLYGDLTIETTGYGIDNGEVIVLMLHVGYVSLVNFVDEFSLSYEDSIHLTSSCMLLPYCGYLSLGNPELDSIRIRVFALQNPLPVLDTIYTGGYLTVGPPGCMIPISVNEHEQSFKVFPSITNDEVEIVGPAEMKYALYDLNGRICSEGKVFSRGTVDVSELAPGMYLMLLQSGNLTFTTKIIHQP